MGKTAAALAMGTTIDYQGQTYHMSPWTYKIQGEFEKHLERSALEAFKAMAPYMTPEERKEELTKIRKEISSGEYTFGSQLVAKSLESLSHLKYLLYLMLKANHPEMTLELASAMTDAQVDEVMGKMAEANADPLKATTEEGTK